MNVVATRLPGVVIIEPRVFRDERGYFFEVHNEWRFTAAGLPGHFVQDNVSYSRGGVLRGLHYQHPTAQGKLVSVLWGEVFDVAVDVRRGSPTFGHWVGEYLSAQNGRQMYVPTGFAHGFLVTSESAVFHYKCTTPYDQPSEGSVLWDDPDLDIAWPRRPEILLSPKDKNAPKLADVPPHRLPQF